MIANTIKKHKISYGKYKARSHTSHAWYVAHTHQIDSDALEIVAVVICVCLERTTIAILTTISSASHAHATAHGRQTHTHTHTRPILVVLFFIRLICCGSEWRNSSILCPSNKNYIRTLMAWYFEWRSTVRDRIWPSKCILCNALSQAKQIILHGKLNYTCKRINCPVLRRGHTIEFRKFLARTTPAGHPPAPSRPCAGRRQERAHTANYDFCHLTGHS